MPHWDPQNVANGMAINRMNTLLEFVTKVSFKPNGPESSTGLPSTVLSKFLRLIIQKTLLMLPYFVTITLTITITQAA